MFQNPNIQPIVIYQAASWLSSKPILICTVQCYTIHAQPFVMLPVGQFMIMIPLLVQYMQVLFNIVQDVNPSKLICTTLITRHVPLVVGLVKQKLYVGGVITKNSLHIYLPQMRIQILLYFGRRPSPICTTPPCIAGSLYGMKMSMDTFITTISVLFTLTVSTGQTSLRPSF